MSICEHCGAVAGFHYYGCAGLAPVKKADTPEEEPSYEEPSYMIFARANVRDGMPSTPTIVRALLDRIARLENEVKP